MKSKNLLYLYIVLLLALVMLFIGNGYVKAQLMSKTPIAGIPGNISIIGGFEKQLINYGSYNKLSPQPEPPDYPAFDLFGNRGMMGLYTGSSGMMGLYGGGSSMYGMYGMYSSSSGMMGLYGGVKQSGLANGYMSIGSNYRLAPPYNLMWPSSSLINTSNFSPTKYINTPLLSSSMMGIGNGYSYPYVGANMIGSINFMGDIFEWK